MEVNNPAGFWRRTGAWIMDAFLISFVVTIITSSMGITFFDEGIGYQSVQFPIQAGYLIVLPVLWYGYTLGKKAVRVRTVKTDGSQVTWGVMIIRVVIGLILYTVSFGILVIVSAIMVAVRADKRAIHDLIAGTYVTRDLPQELK
ncbi:RDD family protein [Alteribacter keqinensis]|nr:RDD family protein [Alteribacter keqinensis]